MSEFFKMVLIKELVECGAKWLRLPLFGMTVTLVLLLILIPEFCVLYPEFAV